MNVFIAQGFRGSAAVLMLGFVAAAGCAPSDSPEVSEPIATEPVATADTMTAFDDPLYVLNVIPENYTMLLDNEHVRVIEARIPPGVTEPPHRHGSGVSIAMTEYLIEHLQPNGEWTPSMQRAPGTVYWSEGSVHQVRNVGTTESHTIRIELK